MTREEWIQKFGSERLKRGVESGYPMNELFMEEFIDKTMVKNMIPPGKVEDFDLVEKMDSPTLEALDLSEKIANILSGYDAEVSIIKGYPRIKNFFDLTKEKFGERVLVEIKELELKFFVTPNATTK